MQTDTISLKPQWLTNQTELEILPKKKEERNFSRAKNNNHQFYNNVLQTSVHKNNGRNINIRSSQPKSVNITFSEAEGEKIHSSSYNNDYIKDPPHTTREHYMRKQAFQSKNNKSSGNSKSCDSLNNYDYPSNPSYRRERNNYTKPGSPSKSPRDEKSSQYQYMKRAPNYNNQPSSSYINNNNNEYKKLYNNNHLHHNRNNHLDNIDEDSQENDIDSKYNSQFDKHHKYHKKKDYRGNYKDRSYENHSNSSYSSSSSNSSEVGSPIYRKKIYGLTKHISSPEIQNKDPHDKRANNDELKMKKHPVHSLKFEPPKISRSGSDSILPFTLSTLPDDNQSNFSSLKSSFNTVCEDQEKNGETKKENLDNNEVEFLKSLGWSALEEEEEEWSLTEEEILEFKENSNLRENILKIREQLKSDFENSIKVWFDKKNH